LISEQEVCVVAGDPVKIKFEAVDPDGDSVRVDFFSELFELAIFQPEITPALTVGKFKQSPSNLEFKMNTSCARVRKDPYILTAKITDRNKNSPPLSRYYTIRIFIIAPPPKIESVIVKPITKQISLEWSIPSCENIQSFQIWRRTSPTDYTETPCSKGMPALLRFDLLALVPANQKTFTDINVEIAAQYCYRIVALVAGNNPGKLSMDTCLIPKSAQAPVITNVSVEDTDNLDGKIFIRWTSPFEIDRIQYPPPYTYQVFRQNETLNTAFEKIGTVQSDTTLVDERLNTTQYAYRYWVELYVPTLSTMPVDSSSEASSIVIASRPQPGQIELLWTANTPWSNFSVKDPYHLIFRSVKKEGPFELIDSINVISNGFLYTDRGRYKNQQLGPDPYFYKIKTRGTYGNPKINDPLENFSPIIPGQVLDSIAPCAPVVEMESISCNQFSCDGKSYYTSLKWSSPDNTCDADVVGYEVLVKSDTALHYASLGTVNQTTFKHSNLTNLDYCYRVVSIDHVGNRSDSSAAICNTSCLNFKLPNVITPGTPDERNDYFAAYGDENSTEDQCARSVNRVELLIYNRWGEEIFLKRIDNQETNILWPGITNSGTEVSSGIYFFKAQVNFQTNDPEKRKQEFKGWVQVLR
jgi:hypothetical protein